MSWEVVSQIVQSPSSYQAKYFLYLAVDEEIMYCDELSAHNMPTRFYGDLSSWTLSNQGTPLIPVDFHTAISVGWVDARTMIRNMPYLTEDVRAAVALVT
jgi:hypothetical protein